MLVFTFAGIWTFAQSTPTPLSPTQESNSTVQAASDGGGYTLHVTTREVVVEVVARDRNNHPVND
jgi:hypothetical protein